MLNTGDIFDDKYRIIKMLGKGGTGQVYLAENVRIGNYWAIKEVDLEKHSRLEFMSECNILKKLNHRNLPKIVDLIERGNFIYIVEDYFEGTGLKELIKSRNGCPEADVVKWALELCDILIYLHNIKPNPIIYRDMKPANIIIDADNNVKLIDLGIAREYKADQDGDTVYIGTRGYAAPEQYSSAYQTDVRTDIYGLGATMYHAVTGCNPSEPPYHMRPVRKLNSALSMEFEKIISTCVQNDPALRYQSIDELVVDLASVLRSNAKVDATYHKVYPGQVQTKTIVIGSLSPRAGSSFLAANLAVSAASKQVPTAVIEFPANTPYLYDALFMGKKVGQPFVSWAHEVFQGNEIDRRDIYTDNGVGWIVLDPTLLKINNWSQENTFNLVYQVKQFPIVILDISTNWTHPGIKQLLTQADLLILVVDPDPVLIERTADFSSLCSGQNIDCVPIESKIVQLLTELQQRPNCNVTPVFNKFTESVDKEQLCLPFTAPIFFPYIEPAQAYKALWEGNPLYIYPHFQDIFDHELSALISQLVEPITTPIELVTGRQTTKDNLLKRVASAFKTLRE